MKKEAFLPAGVFEGMVSLRAVVDAIERGESDRRILRVFVDRGRVKKKERELSYLETKRKTLGFALTITDDFARDTMCTGNSHGGIDAFCTERTPRALSPELIREQGFYLMLDGIEDPYNFGDAVRSAYASGADGVIVPPRNWMSAAGVVCRASAGASERAAILSAEPETAARLFHESGYRVICADKKNAVSVYDSDLKKPLLLIVGGEKRGISRAVLSQADAVVRLDYGRPFGAALSAASAAAVFSFEVHRQNKALPSGQAR